MYIKLPRKHAFLFDRKSFKNRNMRYPLRDIVKTNIPFVKKAPPKPKIQANIEKNRYG